MNTTGANPYEVFVDSNNTVYVPSTALDRVLVWLEGNMTPTRNISGGLNNPCSTFVTLNGDIYVDNGYTNHRVDKWTVNRTNSTTVMYVNGICYSLFLDFTNNLYCSLGNFHQVVKISLYDKVNTSIIVAGNGTAGLASTMLNNPRDVLVDMRLNLYVADCTNDRIQLFKPGFLNGTTVVGNGASGTFILNCPIGIVMDADDHLFISDYHSHRIIGSGPNGFRCIVGCAGVAGSASNQLNNPWSLSFDSHGNLFVADRNNSRIQKFLLATNSCGKRPDISLEEVFYKK